MIWLLSLIFSAYSAPSQLSAYLGPTLERSEGKAFIVKSFVIDGVEYDLDPEQNQMVEAIYWYPSGRIRLKLKNNPQHIDIGFSSPLNDQKGQVATFYFPSDFAVIQKNEVQDNGVGSDGTRFRNLVSKVMIRTPQQERIFMEAKRPQVYINNTWITP